MMLYVISGVDVLALVFCRAVAQGCHRETEGERYLGKKGWGQFVHPKWFLHPKWFPAHVWAKPLVLAEGREQSSPRRTARTGVTHLAPVLPAPRRFKKGQQ